ncbi:MAG: UPF0758 domain-containing protein, partial [Flavobacteriaceae bacterium]
TIKQWADEDRPREKMIAQGAQQLTNAELLALIIGSGIPGTPAVQLMQRLLIESNKKTQKIATNVCRRADVGQRYWSCKSSKNKSGTDSRPSYGSRKK